MIDIRNPNHLRVIAEQLSTLTPDEFKETLESFQLEANCAYGVSDAAKKQYFHPGYVMRVMAGLKTADLG